MESQPQSEGCEQNSQKSESKSRGKGSGKRRRSGRGNRSSTAQKKCGPGCAHFHSQYRGRKRCQVPDTMTCVHFHAGEGKSRRGGKKGGKSKKGGKRGRRSRKQSSKDQQIMDSFS